MNKKTAYSYNKYVAHMDRITKCANDELFAPIFAIIYPVGYCNDSCGVIRCPYQRKEGYLYDYVDRTNAINDKLLLDIPRQLSECNVKGIEVSGGGEPLLHKQIVPFFKEILKSGLDGGLVTNGSRFNDEIINLIKDFKWVRVSINGGNKSDFDMVHNPKTAKGNLDFYGRLKWLEKLNDVKSKETIVGYSFVIGRLHEILENGSLKTLTNCNSVYEAARLAKDIGCDNIRYSLAFTPDQSETFDDIWVTACEQMKMAKAEFEDENFTVFTLANDRRDDKFINSSGKKPFSTCHYAKFTTIINSNAEIADCCSVSYLPKHIVGSLNENTFKEIWFSDDRLKHHNSINVNGDSCSRCFMIGKQTLIQYLLDVINNEAIHLSFP